MSPFYWGLIAGIFIGGNLGVMVIGLCMMAKRGNGCDKKIA